jgi:hypothetical protein
MIITKDLEIKTTNKNISYYKQFFPKIISGDIIKIIPTQLPLTSKIKIDVECEICHEHYNISYYSYVRNINSGLYYCQKCSYIKSETTNLNKYGFKHPMQSQVIKEKVKSTNLKIYNVEYPSQNDDIKKKTENTCVKKYGETSYMKTDDFKKVSRDFYNNNYVEIRDKIENTCIDKYGHKSPLSSDIIKEKIFEKKKLKYNDGHYNNRVKFKKTCLEIFGFENPMSNVDIQDKLKKTMNLKYGVDFASQNEILFQKMLENGYKINKYKDIYYQGTYELDFLEKYYHVGITRGKSIKYFYNNIEHIYFPDFYFDKLNLIVEIKSSKWYQEHLNKNLAKQKACKEQGYNFIFIIDKNYEIFDKIIKHVIYNKEHSWQYEIRLNSIDDFDSKTNLKVSDFTFEYVSEKDKKSCGEIKEFIEKYEWLGKMPNRPTHRFVARYDGKLAGVVIMATPNSFSKLLGENTNNIEKLISRGACAAWTPKNLASSLIMWSIKWMSKNTKFRVFTAYSDTEAKELGTIYQACNFKYLGKKYGSDFVYFDVNKPHLGWFSNRNFHRRSMYKKIAKKLNIEPTWIKVNEIPMNIKKILNKEIDIYINSCIKRKSSSKHKYVYILGENNRETKKLIKTFEELNPKLINLKYPKNR